MGVLLSLSQGHDEVPVQAEKKTECLAFEEKGWFGSSLTDLAGKTVQNVDGGRFQSLIFSSTFSKSQVVGL